jgi:hypothetical protein
VQGTSLNEIGIAREYPDVFPEELPGMPPDRDIEFIIELLPGTPPISKRPYRMPVNELVELKKQRAELQSKGFIHPTSSSWGAGSTRIVHEKERWNTTDVCGLPVIE